MPTDPAAVEVPTIPTPAEGDLLRIAIDLIRDQSRVLSEIATGVAVGADRQAQILTITAKMTTTCDRLDAYLATQETANANARAAGDLALVEERAALTRLYDLVTNGLKSSTGQRIVQTAVLWMLYWFSTHGITVPGVAP